MSDEIVPRRPQSPVYETDTPVRYETDGPVAWITMDRPQFNNAQNSQMTYALDAAFGRATDDDAIKVIVLAGEGKHFSAGHDIGTPGRDQLVPFDRKLMFGDHTTRPAAELLYTREHEVYLGMCRRWRDIPKPTIAMVQGACIAGGLTLNAFGDGSAGVSGTPTTGADAFGGTIALIANGGTISASTLFANATANSGYGTDRSGNATGGSIALSALSAPPPAGKPGGLLQFAATTLDAVATLPLARAWTVEARAENMFDARVEAGISGNNIVERATPRTLWLGLRYRMR